MKIASPRTIGAGAVAALLALAGCAEQDEPPVTVECGEWEAGALPGANPAIPFATGVRWALVDPGGSHVLYGDAATTVALRLRSGERRWIRLHGRYVFPTRLAGPRALVLARVAATGTEDYELLDVERCEVTGLGVRVSTGDVLVGFSRMSAAALTRERALFGVSRGSHLPAEARALVLASGARSSLSTDVRAIREAALEGARAVWLHQRDDATGGISTWDVETGVTWSLELPAAARASGLAVSGARVAWTDRRNVVATPDTDIYLLDLATQETRRLTDDPAGQEQPTLHGRRVAWSDGRSGSWDIRVLDLQTGVETIAAATAASERSPTLTAAGLLWSVTRPAGVDLHLDPAFRP